MPNTVAEEHKSKIVEVDSVIINKVRILRLREVGIDKGGFQRKLDSGRVHDLIEGLKANPNMIIPPILLADTGNELILVDGQHRFEARKRYEYHLFAQVSKMTLDDAIKNFCAVNGTAVRVGIKHRLAIDPGEFATKCRALAKKHSLPANYIYHMIGGLSSTNSFKPNVDTVSSYQWELIETILKEWMTDGRWRSEAQVYGKPGTLKAITRIARDIKGERLLQALKAMKKMNFTKIGPLYDKCGMGYDRQRDMRHYIQGFLLKEMN